MEGLRVGQGVGWARRYPFAVFCILPLLQRWCLYESFLSSLGRYLLARLYGCWLCVQRQMSVKSGLCILS